MTGRKKTQTLDRVLSIAAEKFLSRRFEEVSISEIAMAAHCSNNTIYDVFGTKEDLYRAAIAQNAQRLKIPSPVIDMAAEPLAALVDRTEAWFRFSNDPVVREMFLTIAGHSQKLNALMQSSETDPLMHWDAMKEDAQRCLDAGLLRPFETDTIVHHIIGCTGYLTIVVHALFGDKFEVRLHEQLQRTFAPLLSESGEARFKDIIGARLG